MENYSHKYLYAENKIRDAIKGLEINSRLKGERVFAKDLGVSYMTVRKAVENLVEKGVLYKVPKKGIYVADQKALRKKTKTIGYFLDSSIKDGLTSPYYSLIFNAIEKAAVKKGYSLLYFSDMSDFNELNQIKKIDGAIISCFPRIEKTIQTIKETVPVICIDNNSSDASIASVTIDNFSGVAESIDYLYSLGHERIGFITGLDDSSVGLDRLDGYTSALNRHGITPTKDLIYKGDYTFETGIKGADLFLSLDKRPTAIMCANDTMAIGAIKESIMRGLRVPDDISIVGFDDVSIASQMTPTLTTVAAPIAEIAEHAVNMLSAVMNHTEPADKHVKLAGKLILRETCAPSTDSMPASRKKQQA